MREPLQATIERKWREVADVEDAYARGEISREEWHARMAALVVPAYLAGENPRAQSGYSGTDEDWRQARGLVADAIPRSGTFLDVGCASGLLMECVHAWCRERGLVVEPYGLDIAPELAELARTRLPHWAHRVYEGNVATWTPLIRFDFVRTGLEYVPRDDRRALVGRLLARFLQPGGRLLIGPYTEELDETRAEASLEDELSEWGYNVGGRVERPHRKDERVVRRLVYVDVGGSR
jgi:SAM-dependent methyltransferase